MWRALPAICASIEAREDILVGLIEGTGGHFSAGADISEFAEVYRDAAATRDYSDAIQDGLQAVIALDRPTIAMLRGATVGGGLGLAVACDLRFCAADAYLAATSAKLGLIYGHAETRRLVELVGPSRAKDILFSARRVETEDALAIGLIDRRIDWLSRKPCSTTPMGSRRLVKHPSGARSAPLTRSKRECEPKHRHIGC